MADKKRNEDLLEPLQIALGLEAEGRKFFREAAASIDTRLARQTFEFLAAEEDKHVARIREFYRSIEENESDQPTAFDEGEAEEKLAAFNDSLHELKDEVAPSASDVEAYRLALKFENGAEEFYARQCEQTKNRRVKRFYRWLIREEEMHSRLLRSCLKFAEDPAAWFQDRAKKDGDASRSVS